MPTGIILLQGTLALDAPLLIGSGRNDDTDIDVLVDSAGTPFIPATSLLGVLRRQCRAARAQELARWERFWGFIKSETDENDPDGDSVDDGDGEPGPQSQQSAVRCADLYPLPNTAPTILLRDGIVLDPKTGMVLDQAKYDYQAIDRGAAFSVRLEAEYDQDTEVFVKRMFATIRDVLTSGELYLGAKTNNGLGAVIVREPVRISVFDLTARDDVVRWLCWSPTTELPVTPFEAEPFPLTTGEFRIEAEFALQHSLIVRSYPSSPDKPDAVNVESGGQPVVPGSSLKGAIRARAAKIAKTLNAPEILITDLFGTLKTKDAPKDSKRGKLRVKETRLDHFTSEIQHRIRIDRFTGGTIESALFDTMPVYPSAQHHKIKITLTLQNYQPEQDDPAVGLLLLVLKDLWTGDLAVGGEKNVGRGVLRGQSATLTWPQRTITMTQGFAALEADQQHDLEAFVTALHQAAAPQAAPTQEVAA